MAVPCICIWSIMFYASRENKIYNDLQRHKDNCCEPQGALLRLKMVPNVAMGQCIYRHAIVDGVSIYTTTTTHMCSGGTKQYRTHIILDLGTKQYRIHVILDPLSVYLLRSETFFLVYTYHPFPVRYVEPKYKLIFLFFFLEGI